MLEAVRFATRDVHPRSFYSSPPDNWTHYPHPLALSLHRFAFQVVVTTFATFTLTGNVLDAGTAFVSLSLFNILRFPINLFPMVVSYIVTVSIGRQRRIFAGAGCGLFLFFPPATSLFCTHLNFTGMESIV